jgi:PAS domain S-box-containing protein
MATEFRESGISVVGNTPWGTHLCFFYETTPDLLEILVPYFKAGLENHEFCLWVLSAPLTEEDARSALHQAVPDLERYLAERSLEILPHHAWYLTGGAFDLSRVINGWQEKLAQVLARGYIGMRVSGDTAWIQNGDWRDFREYEQDLDTSIAHQRMIVLCTYPLAARGAAEILNVARIHQIAVVRRSGQWEMVETPELKQAKEEIMRLHAELEQRVIARTSQLTAAYEALHREMAERARAEEALREREMKYRSLFELSHDVILLLDPTGSVLEMNRRGELVTGYTQSELRHMNVFQHLILPEDHAMIRDVIADVAQGRAREYEVRWRTKTGSIVYLDGASVPRFAPSGEFLSTLCTLRDMTERKRAEEALRQSACDLAEAQRVARLGSWSLDIAPNTVQWSAELYRIFDVEKTAFGGTYETFLSRIHPDDRTRVLQINAEAKSSGAPFEVEYRITTRSGQLKHIREVGYARKDRAGAVSGLFGTAQDITEYKHAEEALRTYPRRLIETQEAERQRIAREMHDEIGQALTAIRLNLQVMQSATDASRLAPQWQDSIGLIDRALQQVRDLAFDLRPALLDDLGLVAALRWYVDREAQRAGFRAAFVADLSETCVPAELHTACFRIAQAALTNVVRHAQARQVWVELRQRAAELHLVIRDDGVGFEVRALGTRRTSEVHLGLQGMQERTRILGGQLDITSAPGRGTEIHARFPLRSPTPPQSRERNTA